MTDDLRLFRPAEDGGPESALTEVFGSASNDFWIIDGGRIPWPEYVNELDSLFATSVHELFIHYQPWKPSANSKKNILRKQIGDVAREVADTLFLVSRPAASMRTIFDTRDACGGANSGLWLIVAARQAIENKFIDRLLSWGAFGSPLLVAQAVYDEATAILSLDEGAWSTLLVRRDHPERQRLIRVYSSLQER